MSKLQEYIDKEKQLDRLDIALLSISSSFGLGLTFMYSFFAAKGVLYFLPLLFLGWAMPVYVGYIRGALIINRLEERVRGWIYLFVGVPFYFYFLIDRLIKDYFPTITTQDYFYLVSLIVLFVLAIVVFNLTYWITRVIFRIFKRKPVKEIEDIFAETSLSALIFAGFFVILFLVGHEWNLILISMLIIFFAEILWMEKRAQRRLEAFFKTKKSGAPV